MRRTTARLPTPASQQGDKQTPSLSIQLWKHLFRLSTFPLTARHRRSLRPAFHVQDMSLPRKKGPRPGCATGVQRRFKPLKQTSLHQQHLHISFKCINPYCPPCSEERDCTPLFALSLLSLQLPHLKYLELYSLHLTAEVFVREHRTSE